MRGNGFGVGRAGRLGNEAAHVGVYGDGGTTSRFHRPLQPCDSFIDPTVVVLGIGQGLLPECICLMQARRSAIHAPPPVPRSRPIASFLIPRVASLT